ncbi:Predicted ATPase of the ABC class [Peptoclostridium litorale DSM 5388]|uniref:Putative glutamine transport system ATP-binding protein n=1 Tax=Peptoclostridium litorale DSM 5388 TaxID=1121324 RepID=A0A069REJ8_PEPLI|nr:ABC-ATPase domain-containing protein [Peptoclostridium litorale]KDR95489.1 putative glutamine transport system ATP-binding protein [Peptoclostridium litorale DSM 5388]SIO17613.1 Predicted ATPase of the ABC class [Peptoclostridium litorale DSM 5388]
MKSFQELEKILNSIDGRGYKAYKDLKGEYGFGDGVLHIDYVQGDPFASPSRVRVRIPASKAGFPTGAYDTPCRRRATVDFLSRTVARNIYRLYDRVGGSGKSGLLSIGHCGQEIIERNYVVIDKDMVEARLEVGLPAAGRRVLAAEARRLLTEAIPQIAKSSLLFESINQKKLMEQVRLAEDQQFLREEVKSRKLSAFVANGSILPRESGVSQRPMAKGAVPFKSPREYEIEINLPNRGAVRGMGIPEGVTLIVGGGFHGKSTLLQAIELGVYDHLEGDGREYIATRDTAVKIKAENGRSVEKVDISPFISNLPAGQDTVRFSTENASGSTSQAANIMESLEIGTELLLIDEDTSATNFMIRDARMQQLVQKEKEPITPFIDRVRGLYENKGVSTILVIGGSGDYFEVADHVIMMDEYSPRDVTGAAREIVSFASSKRKAEGSSAMGESPRRAILRSSFSLGRKGVKIKPRGTDQILYNNTDIDIRDMEQLVDPNQTSAICFIMEYIMKNIANDKMTLTQVVERVYGEVESKGLDALSPYKGHPGNMALPRKHEIIGVLNRFRDLKIK